VPGVGGALRDRPAKLAQQLREGKFLFRVNFPVPGKHATYSMFIKQVDWSANVTEKFRAVRHKLLRVRYAASLSAAEKQFAASHPAIRYNAAGRPTLLRKYMEKSSVELFSLPGLRRFLRLGEHNLIKDMRMQPCMCGNIRTACDLIDSLFQVGSLSTHQPGPPPKGATKLPAPDAADGKVRCSPRNIIANVSASQKPRPRNIDSAGGTHIGIKHKYALRVFATEPHARKFETWGRTDYTSSNATDTNDAWATFGSAAGSTRLTAPASPVAIRRFRKRARRSTSRAARPPAESCPTHRKCHWPRPNPRPPHLKLNLKPATSPSRKAEGGVEGAVEEEAAAAAGQRKSRKPASPCHSPPG
jgi:hypothetical protein